jgi:hypothetical protein
MGFLKSVQGVTQRDQKTGKKAVPDLIHIAKIIRLKK